MAQPISHPVPFSFPSVGILGPWSARTSSWGCLGTAAWIGREAGPLERPVVKGGKGPLFSRAFPR